MATKWNDLARYACRVEGSAVIWTGTDRNDPARPTREFRTDRGTHRAAKDYARALCRSGTACLLPPTREYGVDVERELAGEV